MFTFGAGYLNIPAALSSHAGGEVTTEQDPVTGAEKPHRLVETLEAIGEVRERLRAFVRINHEML